MSTEPVVKKLITHFCFEFQQMGYLVELRSPVPEVKALLYARSTQSVRLGFAKVDHYFLFVDYDDLPFGSLDELKEIYKQLSAQVNQSYKIPRAWRMHIPSMAVVALSQTEFLYEVRSFVSESSLTPWLGGEAGQIILVDVVHQQVFTRASYSAGEYPIPGALPLSDTAGLISKMCERVFNPKENHTL